ncbi:hypothetical protein ACFSYH_02070 [Populibacterium corticicola]|uniref:Uncharacterized protein n=1 Tax=Populibacterium corticicola TaxID=1812826 RepID=A0ABW5XBV0_9MICO
MTTPTHPKSPVDELIDELDLLAVAISVGVLSTTRPEPAGRHRGDRVPTVHNTLILITRLHGHDCHLPAVYNETVGSYQILVDRANSIDGCHWVGPDEIQAFTPAQVVPA